MTKQDYVIIYFDLWRANSGDRAGRLHLMPIMLNQWRPVHCPYNMTILLENNPCTSKHYLAQRLNMPLSSQITQLRELW